MKEWLLNEIKNKKAIQKEEIYDAIMKISSHRISKNEFPFIHFSPIIETEDVLVFGSSKSAKDFRDSRDIDLIIVSNSFDGFSNLARKSFVRSDEMDIDVFCFTRREFLLLFNQYLNGHELWCGEFI